MIGYLGLTILLTAYIFLLFKKVKLFFLVDLIASIILTFYAVLLKDIPFIVVNGFISIVLFVKLYDRDRSLEIK